MLIDAEPIGAEAEDPPNILLVFRTVSHSEPTEVTDETAKSELSLTERLERTIREMSEKLQATIEEYETAVEELKSANEEMLSVNEELQSSNEELEASKEEMQSLNEELNTINSELTIKVDEIDRAHSHLRNLYESTQIASVLLDKDLMIRQFTPAARRFFSLRKGDIGRPLTKLASVSAFPKLRDQISAVLKDGQTIEQLGFGADNARYLVRLIPYRRDNGEIDGVVVTFFDISQLAQAEVEALQETMVAELNDRVKDMLTIVISIVRETLGSQTGLEHIVRLLGRLQSMSNVYGLLSEGRWTGVDIADLIRQDGSSRIRVEGADVRISPRIAPHLSMVLHELATNALKHGALSNATGHIVVKWEIAGDRFHLTWRKFDGPPIERIEQEGFGVVFMRGQVEYRLGGTFNLSLDPEGVRVEIDVPMA